MGIASSTQHENSKIQMMEPLNSSSCCTCKFFESKDLWFTWNISKTSTDCQEASQTCLDNDRQINSLSPQHKWKGRNNRPGGESYRIESPTNQSEPKPFRNWTTFEQQVLIHSLHEHPQARENASYRFKLIERIQRQLPQKSMEEIEACYDYLQAVRRSHRGFTQSLSSFKSIKPATFQT